MITVVEFHSVLQSRVGSAHAGPEAVLHAEVAVKLVCSPDEVLGLFAKLHGSGVSMAPEVRRPPVEGSRDPATDHLLAAARAEMVEHHLFTPTAVESSPAKLSPTASYPHPSVTEQLAAQKAASQQLVAQQTGVPVPDAAAVQDVHEQVEKSVAPFVQSGPPAPAARVVRPRAQRLSPELAPVAAPEPPLQPVPPVVAVSTPAPRSNDNGAKEFPPELLKEKRHSRVVSVLHNRGWKLEEVQAWAAAHRADCVAFADVPDPEALVLRAAKLAGHWGLSLESE